MTVLCSEFLFKHLVKHFVKSYFLLMLLSLATQGSIGTHKIQKIVVFYLVIVICNLFAFVAKCK